LNLSRNLFEERRKRRNNLNERQHGSSRTQQENRFNERL
jgi:hypothetical protein